MRAASLLLVFVLAKMAVLSGHAPALSGWSPVAYLWQDVAAALLFAALDTAAPKTGRVIYWMLAIYAAVNIPVGRVVFTPLTWPMLRAARGPLADSLLLYVTWKNALLVAATLAAAAALPLLLERLPRRFFRLAAAGALGIVAMGPMASARVDTLGLDRNVLAALIGSRRARGDSRPVARAWRRSPFPCERAEDLSALRGAATGRNVIMVSLESTAEQYVSPEVMPNLSALARDALVFENAYAVYPESIKGLFSVLCSAYPLFDSLPEAYAHAPCRSLAAVLAEAGYRTGLFHSGRFGYLGMESIVRNRGYQTLEDAGDIGGNYNSSFGVDEPSTVTRILAWIDALPSKQRFFLTYLPIAGHHPYETPERGPFRERSEMDRYRNALHYGDASLGTLVEGLRARGLFENTLWIVFGDHGEAFGQHEGNYGHTFFLYDENVRVPLVIAAPGLIRGRTRVRNAVSLVDIAPGALELLGIPPPAGYQGESLLDGAPRMSLFFTDYSLRMCGLRDGRWKFIYELESGRAKLFDLEVDPGETADVDARHPERAAWYRRILRE